MVALLGLLEPLLVVLERVAALPRGAVDALQLRVLLAPPPVRRRGPGQLERRDVPGGRQVRPAAEVLPRQRAVLADVVVDGELAAADLGLGALGRSRRSAALEADQLELVGLGRELGAGVVVGDLAAHERLPLLDDLLHLLLDGGEIVGGERRRDVEVVVEAVLDRRPDAQPGVRVQLLHRLRHDVRGRVPQDRPAVGRVDRHRLDVVAVLEDVSQVAQLAADPGRDHRAVAVEDVRGRRAGGDLALAAGDVDAEVWHRWSLHGVSCGPGDRIDRPRPISPAFRRDGRAGGTVRRG